MILNPPKRLIDLYNNPRKSGIFYHMFTDGRFSEIFNIINIVGDTIPHSIDYEYIYKRSGLKSTSLLLEELYKGVVIDSNLDIVTMLKDGSTKVTWDYVVQEVDKTLINDILYVQYYNKWFRLAKTTTMQYDALSPYNMIINDDLTSTIHSDNSKTNHQESGSTDTTNERNTDTTSKVDYAGIEQNTDKLDTTNTNTLTNTSSSDSTDTTNYNRTGTDNRDVTRKGNIGNITSQDLINKEREVTRYIILNEIFSDLDAILTSKKYL